MRAGDFVHAKVHFAKAVERTPNSAAALHNLGLAEARLEAYTPAVYYLREALELARVDRDERQELAALYNLALALRSQGEERSKTPPRLGQVRKDAWPPEAQAHALELARRVLSLPEDDAMRASALLLTAGIIRRRNQQLTDAAAYAAIVEDEPPEVEAVRRALGEGTSGPADDAPILLERFVSTGAARKDLRVRYNHACYLAGLGSDTSDALLREPLWTEAIEELDLALADGSLVALALVDPALATLLSLAPRAREVVGRHSGDVTPATAVAGLSLLDVVGPSGADRLAAAGITDALTLVQRTGDEAAAGELAERLDVPVAEIATWAAAGRLVVALGIAPEHANLLIAAGFGDLERIAHADPSFLLGAIAEVNARRSLVPTLPELWTVRLWIWRAERFRDPGWPPDRHGGPS